MLTLLIATALATDSPDWHQLRPVEASATSYLKSNWNKYTENYHPMYVLDGDPKTAWVEGESGNGEGSLLDLPLTNLASARAVKLRVRNGYQKSPSLQTANAAPKAVTVRLLDRGGRVVHTQSATLGNTAGWQEILLAGPFDKAFARVQLQIDEVHPGRTYKDTCVSDVEVWVDSEVPYNAAAEAAKHGRAMAWIRERTEAAAYFAGKPADYAWGSAQFAWQQKPTPLDEATFTTASAAARAQHAALAGPWYRMSPANTQRLPEGLWDIDKLEQFVPSGQMTFFETDADTLKRIHRGYEGEEAEDGFVDDLYRGSAHVRFEPGDQPVPAAVSFRTRHVVEERMSYVLEQEWLLTFDGGRLEHAWAWGASSDEFGPYTSASHWSFTWTEGKVTALRKERRTDYTAKELPPWGERTSLDTVLWTAK